MEDPPVPMPPKTVYNNVSMLESMRDPSVFSMESKHINPGLLIDPSDQDIVSGWGDADNFEAPQVRPVQHRRRYYRPRYRSRSAYTKRYVPKKRKYKSKFVRKLKRRYVSKKRKYRKRSSAVLYIK